VLAPVDPAPPPDFGKELQQLASEFSAAAAQLLTIDSAVIGAYPGLRASRSR